MHLLTRYGNEPVLMMFGRPAQDGDTVKIGRSGRDTGKIADFGRQPRFSVLEKSNCVPENPAELPFFVSGVVQASFREG
jgi:hypothetical protein